MPINGRVWLAILAATTLAGAGSASRSAPPAAPSLCVAGETPVLSCGVKGGKILSLCASGRLDTAAATRLQYRFGRRGAPELVWPTGPEAPAGRFRLAATPYAGGGEERIRFSIGAFDYVVFQRTIAGDWNPDGTRDHFQDEGVAVLRAGKVVGRQTCTTAVANEGFPKMYDLLEREETEPLDIPCCGKK
jgi:hypothetical protein